MFDIIAIHRSRSGCIVNIVSNLGVFRIFKISKEKQMTMQRTTTALLARQDQQATPDKI